MLLKKKKKKKNIYIYIYIYRYIYIYIYTFFFFSFIIVFLGCQLSFLDNGEGLVDHLNLVFFFVFFFLFLGTCCFVISWISSGYFLCREKGRMVVSISAIL